MVNRIGLLDARGAEIVVYTYDAWGNVIADGGKSFCYEGNEVPFELNHVLYRGYYYDGSCNDTENDTNLYYLQSRYYDSKVGRFINADDVEVFEIKINTIYSDNLYIYCNSNPVNSIDSNGYMEKHWYNSTKWVARIIDLAVFFWGIGSSYKAVITFIRKNRNKVLKVCEKELRKAIGWNAAGMIASALNVVCIVAGTSLGSIIANALDYVDPWFGYKRNNKYIFN